MNIKINSTDINKINTKGGVYLKSCNGDYIKILSLNIEIEDLFTEENCTLSLTLNNFNKSVLDKVINEVEKENKRLKKLSEIKNKEYLEINKNINKKPYYRKERY